MSWFPVRSTRDQPSNGLQWLVSIDLAEHTRFSLTSGNLPTLTRPTEATMSVKKVSVDRWLEAQRWELDLWQGAQAKHGWRRFVVPLARPIARALGSDRGQGDDWNHWWADRFDGYSILPDDIGDYIEVGCGPYTNTRLITQGRNVRRIVCSDPLIRSYIQFKHRWLADAYHRGLILIDDHPLEEIPFAPMTFDVVVLINVLDHVYDFDLCMRNATGLVRSGGYVVIGQDLSNEEEAKPRMLVTQSE